MLNNPLEAVCVAAVPTILAKEKKKKKQDMKYRPQE